VSFQKTHIASLKYYKTISPTVSMFFLILSIQLNKFEIRIQEGRLHNSCCITCAAIDNMLQQQHTIGPALSYAAYVRLYSDIESVKSSEVLIHLKSFGSPFSESDLVFYLI